MNPDPLIAIVGIGGLFPGAADLAGFWSNVLNRVDAAREVPTGRWLLAPAEAYDPRVGVPDKVYSTRGCFLDGIPLDPAGLDVDPALLAQLDPLFQLVLYAGRQAFADAVTAGLDRRRVGVVLGNIALPTEKASALAREILGRTFEEKLLGPGRATSQDDTEPLNRYPAGLPAGLLAKALGLGGGTYTLDAACASSLYALKLAADELRAGRADAMLTGGVSRPDPLYTQMGFSQLRALSPSGRCAPFDAAADGLVVGEGAGVFLLKRLDDALRDGDHVYAVIRGIGLSNDVGGNLLAPASEGQLRAMRAAYRQAGWSPADVDLIECHATGTPVGDAVEFESLRALWGQGGWDAGQCVLGSVKSTVGHLLTAAGSAGLLKVLFALRAGTLPPTANFTTPGPRLGLDGSPFRVLIGPEEWRRRGAEVPRRAAISGFGFGGVNAHVLLEEYFPAAATSPGGQAFLPAAPGQAGMPVLLAPVAVVGLGARFGPWTTLAAFRDRVLGLGPPAKPYRKRYDWGVSDAGAALAGYYLDELAVPLERFRIPPKELQEMLPQQLLMLLVAAEALDDAGGQEAHRPSTGAFVGIGLDLNTTNFHCRWWVRRQAAAWVAELGWRPTAAELDEWVGRWREAAGPALNANRTMGALGSIVASRVARAFHFGGPSFTLSAEESSGAKALEAAVRALQRGELDVALAGAVDLAGDPRAVLATHAGRPFSRSGEVRPFDPAADGTVPGEGAAAVVLKRLDDARAAGDRVYAVIRGIGTAGGAEGLMPTESAYTLALERAYAEAGVAPVSVGYVEAHGSGSPAEDELEARALAAFFGKNGVPPQAVGSAKAAVGHAGAASALAGLVKVCLSLHEQVLTSLGGLRRPQYWLHNAADGPRRAGLSSFSVDGNCAHVVLEEAPASKGRSPSRAPAISEALFAVEADNAFGLSERLARLRSFLAATPDAPLSTLARRWWREHRPDPAAKCCVALLAHDAAELNDLLGDAEHRLAEAADQPAADRPSRDRLFYSPRPLGLEGGLAFVFPGSGNHFPGMGRDLALAFPEVIRRQQAANARLRSQYAPEFFWDEPSHPADARTLILGQVTLGCLVSDVLQGFGVRPEAVLGYSLGESAGLFALGAWTDRDSMYERLKASSLFVTDLTGPCHAARRTWGLRDMEEVAWVAGVLDVPAEAVRAALPTDAKVYLLIVNTPGECVVGGRRAEVEHLVAGLGCRFIPLEGITTVHCEVARQVEDAYRALHLLPTTPPPGVRFYSGAWGRAYEVSRESAAEAITAQAVGPIDFPAAVEAAYHDGVRLFVEVGPGASCTRMVGHILSGRPHLARSACPAGQEEPSTVLRLLATLLAERVPVDLSPLYGAEEEATAVEEKTLVMPVGGPAFQVPRPVVERGDESPMEFQPPPAAADAPLLAPFTAARAATAQAHAVYLRFAETARQQLAGHLTLQHTLLHALPAVSEEPPRPPAFLDYAQCLEFAVGKIGDVLGPTYAAVDAYPTRVRLPDEPLMLVDRILEVHGEPRSLTHGRVVTEHDVHTGRWYLDNGRIPTCVAVEAGQADLFLAGYLGIDFQTKGLAVYRLLDAAVTFHRGLPGPGETVRYDITIREFFRQDQTYLFRFQFEGTVNGEPLLTMRDGCAGFFTAADLAAGKGVVRTALSRQPRPGVKPADWEDLVPVGVESYDADRLDALRQGDLAGCFGPAFAGLPLQSPCRLPDGLLRLVERVTSLDPRGGRFGLGLIRAEADIHPDDWFLTCHFIDDQVMPGTLMYECCLHTLRIFLMRLGWVAEHEEAVWEPVPGVASRLKCRGQVTAATRVAAYEVEVKELGYRPEPYAIVDALMYADGKAIVEITDMTLRLTGQTREALQSLWKPARSASEGPPLFGPERILAFSVGDPSAAFGEPYRVFDRERVIARLPGPPYLFLDRITQIEAEPWVMRAGGVIEAEYDVPPDAWYFAADRQPTMPFAVLLEVALQPCGWLAAYLGSALTSPIDLSFRNLGGKATWFEPVGPDAGTLTTRVTITKASHSAGMIIQHYDYEGHRGGRPVYRGDTYFGFFTKQALAQQVGIREATPYQPSAEEQARGERFPYLTAAPFPDTQLRMVDAIDLYVADGGPHGLGFVRGTKTVNPDEWFFKAHFYQDPVCPGSLGLESFLQLLKVVAAKRWGAAHETSWQAVALDRPHRWSYRGQVLPTDRLVTVEAVVTAVDDAARTLRADGYLSVDGRLIYAMNDFSLRQSH